MQATTESSPGRQRAKLPTKQVDQILRDIVTKRYFLTKTAIEKYVKVLYGKSKKVRFKGKWDNILASVHSKSTDTGIMFDPETLSISYIRIVRRVIKCHDVFYA